MNELTCAGRFPGNESRVRSGGNSHGRRRGSAGRYGWAARDHAAGVHRDRRSSIPSGSCPRMQHLGGAGNDDLSAMGGGHQARAPIDRQARVTGVVDDDRLVGVQTDARLSTGVRCAMALLPAPVGMPPRRIRRRRQLRRRRPCHRPCAQNTCRRWAAIVFSRISSWRTMAAFIASGILLPKARGPFEIGEQERHRARWRMPSHGPQTNSEAV